MKNKIIINLFYLIGSLIISVLSYLIIFNGIFLKVQMDSKTKAYEVDWNEYENDGIWLKPTFYYEVNDVSYSCKTIYASGNNIFEKSNIVYYDSKNPEKCISKYSSSPKKYVIFLGLFPFLGIIYSIINLSKSSF